MVVSTLRRYPFTVGGLLTIVVFGVLFGTFGTQVADHPWRDAVTYGLPATQDGRWWTVITGVPFAITPLCYVAVLGSFAAMVGFAEHRLGTARAMLAWGYGHVVGVAGAIGVLALTGGPLASAMDVGPSGGALAAFAVATAALSTWWRLYTRLGLAAYAIGSLFILGELADVVHLVAVAVALPVGALFVRGLRPARPAANSDRALHLLEGHGGGTLSWMTTWPGCEYLYAQAGDGYLAYRRHAGVAMVLGDPVGSPEWLTRAPAEFAAHCARLGLLPCWFSVSAATADAVGTKRVQVAEDTLIDLADLKFRGKAWQDVRTARNRATKDGIEFRLITLADADPSIIAQVREVSTSWLRGKKTPELGFTLGGVNEAMDPRVRVGIAVDAAGTVHGVTSWLPILDDSGRPRGWTLDMMRRRTDGFRPVIEFLIAEACLAFQEEGATLVSLSGAPLARGGCAGRSCPMQRLLDVLGTLLEPLYGFRSLHAFKSKFQPRREPLYLVYRSVGDLPLIGAAVLRAYLAKPAAPAQRRPVSVPVLARPVVPRTPFVAHRRLVPAAGQARTARAHVRV